MNRKIWNLHFTDRAALLLCLLGCAALTYPLLLAQGRNPSAGTAALHAPASPLPSPPAMVASDVSAFMDGIVPSQMERSDIAGGVVVVVKDGQILFAKGYGFADAKKRTPVSVSDTLFRPGSISKLFTWTAVMQLVQEGKIDLNRDVNAYLDFRIPATYSHPITMLDLMTHAPGFEESIKDLITTDKSTLQPLAQLLPTHLPARIFPPGSIPAYSNYGAALAGYIVQRVSGEPFDQYIQDHILDPLQMKHSTFEQPLPPVLAPLMSSGYELGSGPAKPFELIPFSPAGALSTTGMDMANFMIAHLQDGAFEGQRILSAQTAEQMHSRQFGLDAGLNAMCLGFYEDSRNGQRIIGHDGDTIYFHSRLRLIPGANVGFFISLNSGGNSGQDIREEIWKQFVGRYFPYVLPSLPALATAAAHDRAVAGSYLTTRRSQTSFLAVANLLSQLKVASEPDNTIQLDGFDGFNGQPLRFREVRPFFYRETHGQFRLSFQWDSTGHLLLATDIPVFAFQKLPWYRGANFCDFVFLYTCSILLLALILWPVAAILRRHYRHTLSMSPLARILRLLVRLWVLLDVIVLAAWASLLGYGFSHLDAFTARSDAWFHLLQVLTAMGLLGVVLACFYAAAAWFGRILWRVGALGEILLALAFIGYVWIVFAGNLLHFRLVY